MKDSIWSVPGNVEAPVPNEKRHEKLLREQFESIPGTTWGEKLHYLSSCKCCVRHMIGKPTTIAPWEDSRWPSTQETPCKCNCRHLARFICRQCDETGNMPPCPIGGVYPF